MKLNGRAPQTNSYTHSVTNLAAETGRYRNTNYKMKNIKLRLKITDFHRRSQPVRLCPKFGKIRPISRSIVGATFSFSGSSHLDGVSGSASKLIRQLMQHFALESAEASNLEGVTIKTKVIAFGK
jgi:hypothetical protein